MPDHQILETCELTRYFQNFDFAIFCLASCESLGCGQNQFGPRNAPRGCAEIWQSDYSSTPMTVRCETLLRYMLRPFYYINTDVLSREILFERELTLVGCICRNNADELFLVNDLGQ
jgi:hypothetical protein